MSSPEESKATHRNRQKSSTSSPSKDDSVSGLSSTTLEPKTKPTLAVVEQELQEIERMSHESFSESVISIEQVIRSGHFWAVVILTAKCCGEIFASMWIGYWLLSVILRKCLLALFFIYIVAPIFAYLLNQKTPMNILNMAERRWLVLIFSFWVGASTHYILVNWDPGVFPSPPFYSPALVAILFEFIGPKFANNRPLLLLSTIGAASCVCFAYAFINASFNFTYFYTSVIAIASSFYNMQLHLADPNLGRGDMSEGHVLLPIHSMYNQLAATIIFGRYVWNRDPSAAVPNSLEERYTLLLRRLH